MLIQKGSSGAPTRAWQTDLLNAGYSLTVDGIFGPETHSATVEFQKSMGITADGIVGQQTLQAMFMKKGLADPSSIPTTGGPIEDISELYNGPKILGSMDNADKKKGLYTLGAVALGYIFFKKFKKGRR